METWESPRVTFACFQRKTKYQRNKNWQFLLCNSQSLGNLNLMYQYIADALKIKIKINFIKIGFHVFRLPVIKNAFIFSWKNTFLIKIENSKSHSSVLLLKKKRFLLFFVIKSIHFICSTNGKLRAGLVLPFRVHGQRPSLSKYCTRWNCQYCLLARTVLGSARTWYFYEKTAKIHFQKTQNKLFRLSQLDLSLRRSIDDRNFWIFPKEYHTKSSKNSQVQYSTSRHGETVQYIVPVRYRWLLAPGQY